MLLVGMPEAVYMWTQERDIELVRKTLNNILEAYERDFAKHPNIYEFPKNIYDMEINSFSIK